ncbi:MAG: GNAT family N-acetyltransferase [Lachnospira eligens]
MEIQNVTIEDAEELLDIYAPYVKYTAITFEYDVPSVEEFRQRIVNISDRYPYIKAVDNGQIVGYAYAGYCARRKQDFNDDSIRFIVDWDFQKLVVFMTVGIS